MAANYRTSKYRTTSLSERDKSGFYVYGNTVRQAETTSEKQRRVRIRSRGSRRNGQAAGLLRTETAR